MGCLCSTPFLSSIPSYIFTQCACPQYLLCALYPRSSNFVRMQSPSTLPPAPSIPSFPRQLPSQTLPVSFVPVKQPQDGHDGKNRVFYYYFLFLALLTAVLAALLWWLHRQKRSEQHQARLRGHDALARDVERWAMNRRDRLPPIEGLHGVEEPPPPYELKDAIVVSQVPVDGTSWPVDGVTVPPRALSRSETAPSPAIPPRISSARKRSNFEVESLVSQCDHSYVVSSAP